MGAYGTHVTVRRDAAMGISLRVRQKNGARSINLAEICFPVCAFVLPYQPWL